MSAFYISFAHMLHVSYQHFYDARRIVFTLRVCELNFMSQLGEMAVESETTSVKSMAVFNKTLGLLLVAFVATKPDILSQKHARSLTLTKWFYASTSQNQVFFWEKYLEIFLAVSLETKTGYISQEVGPFPSIIMATKTSILSQTRMFS